MHNVGDVWELVGNTPLIRLKRVSEETGCEVLGKAEFLNPGGSIKDRTALGILKNALEKGHVREGGAIVEGTAGNTGIGLALLGRPRGLLPVIVMPETQSDEKKETLRAVGADLRLVPAVPYKDDNHYTKVARRLAEELAQTQAGAYFSDQFDNVANRAVHRDTTAVEIWDQTAGKIDGFTCAIGTGGTLGGVADYLKHKNADIRIAAADPHGATMYSWFTEGKLISEGDSVMEGIGQGRVTANIADAPVDTAYRIDDADAIAEMHHLAQEEGLWLGGSSGINVVGARRLAKELGPGHTIVTILCDVGTRYQSKLFNNKWLAERSFPLMPIMGQ